LDLINNKGEAIKVRVVYLNTIV